MRLPGLVLLAWGTSSAAVGCGSADDSGMAGTQVASGGAHSGGGGSGATGETGGGGSGGGLALGGGGPGGAGGATGGCQKIDFLFIVDNSASMENDQAKLTAAFPGFISAIEATVNAGGDYHVMVTDTDAWGRCNTANPWKGMDPSSSLCNAYVQSTQFDECDRAWGAGVVHPAGAFASNQLCALPAGRRYLQQGDPNVAGAFGCAAKVGTAGHSSERPMDALVAALTPAINGPGGCNQGFLRDDALLVVTFISDDSNYEDQGTPESWYQAVVAAKKGDPNAVAMVGFTPVGCGGGGKTGGTHWEEFVKKVPFNLHAQVCSADYVGTFTQAVKLVDETCDKYVPPVN
ncbi:MAG: hypothetical protein IT377_14870 [Polyangiaceae bacterium]|nr:hypothetical protein [Polyangiaceae bacterium]